MKGFAERIKSFYLDECLWAEDLKCNNNFKEYSEIHDKLSETLATEQKEQLEELFRLLHKRDGYVAEQALEYGIAIGMAEVFSQSEKIN